VIPSTHCSVTSYFSDSGTHTVTASSYWWIIITASSYWWIIITASSYWWIIITAPDWHPTRSTHFGSSFLLSLIGQLSRTIQFHNTWNFLLKNLNLLVTFAAPTHCSVLLLQ
jgi:hypothetical protein